MSRFRAQGFHSTPHGSHPCAPTLLGETTITTYNQLYQNTVRMLRTCSGPARKSLS